MRAEGGAEVYVELKQHATRGLEAAAVYVALHEAHVHLTLRTTLQPEGQTDTTRLSMEASDPAAVPLAFVDQLKWDVSVAGVDVSAGCALWSGGFRRF